MTDAVADVRKVELGRKARTKLGVVDGGGDDNRPLVRIVAGEMADVTTRVEQLLIRGGAPLYVRGTTIVRAVDEKQIASDGQNTSTVALHPVDKVYLRDQMNKKISFERFDKKAKDWLSCNAPMDVAETILARKGEWHMPTVAGVINAPTLRPDGTVICAPGYDEQTGLILRTGLKLPPMPDKPTRADALNALELLTNVLEDFSFVAGDSETLECNAALSVALSMMISPTIRGAMDVCPMHAVTAPTAGTGKSILCSTSSAIALGERCSVISVNSNDEETEKRLSAKAMAGHPIISLDNVNGELGGDTLCQLISETTVEVRVLGLSQMVRVPNRFCIFANGNNLRLKGDVTRRAITCRMDAGMERPSEREFQRNPFEEIMADRGRYVAACLTIARAYFVAGRPLQMVNDKPLTAMNNFEQWSRTVRSALIWLGCADPVSTVASAQAADPELQANAAFITAFQEEIGVGKLSALTAAQLMTKYEETVSYTDHAPKFPKLREAINSAPVGRPSSRSLAKWLSRIIDRPIGVSAIKSTPVHGGIAAYYAEVVQ